MVSRSALCTMPRERKSDRGDWAIVLGIQSKASYNARRGSCTHKGGKRTKDTKDFYLRFSKTTKIGNYIENIAETSKQISAENPAVAGFSDKLWRDCPKSPDTNKKERYKENSLDKGSTNESKKKHEKYHRKQRKK